MQPTQLHELDLHLTNRCTLRCRGCCFDSGVKPLAELTTEKVASVLKEAAGIGCSELHLTGGEPLMRTDVEDIIVYAKGLGMEVRLQTNGTLLSDQRADALIRAGLHRVMISLDSASPEVNDALRGQGAYSAASRAITLCMEKGLQVRVNAVLSHLTLGGFPTLVAACAHLGVSKVSGFYYSPIGRGRRNGIMWIPPRQYIVGYRELEESVSQMRNGHIPAEMDVVIERAYATWDEAGGLDTAGFTGCGGGCSHAARRRDYMIVRSDGNVYPCILMSEWDESLGNVHCQALHEIWMDDEAWKMLDRGAALRTCGDCVHRQVCQGGCAGYARLMGGGAEQSDPRCVRGNIVPLCPIMKYNLTTDRYGGSSEDVMGDTA